MRTLGLVAVALWLAGCSFEPFGGSQCKDNADCGKDGFCRHVIFAGNECHWPLGRGERCDPVLYECAAGLSCNAGLEPPRCEEPAPLGSRCGDNDDCAGGAVCNGDGSDARLRCTTKATVAEGGGCTNAYACSPGLGCVAHRCTPPGSEGDPCQGWPIGPDVPDCESALYCFGGVCIPLGEEGEPCGSCIDGLLCKHAFDPPRCEPPAEDGEFCNETDECAAGLVCGSGSTCRVAIPLGGACVDRADCGDNRPCVFGRCAERLLGDGDTCATDTDCLFGSFCGDGVCTAGRARGEACSRDRECRYSLCRDGLCG